MKWELEDTALRYLNPQQYYRIVSLMKKKRDEREAYLDNVMDEINSQLEEVEIEADVYGSQSIYIAFTVKWCCKRSSSMKFMIYWRYVF